MRRPGAQQLTYLTTHAGTSVVESYNARVWHWLTKSIFYPKYFRPRAHWATALWNFADIGRLQSSKRYGTALSVSLERLPAAMSAMLDQRKYLARWAEACQVIPTAVLDMIPEACEMHVGTERRVKANLWQEFTAAAAGGKS